jgi:hypothetical protein
MPIRHSQPVEPVCRFHPPRPTCGSTEWIPAVMRLLVGLILHLLTTALDVLSQSVHRVAASKQRDTCGDSYDKKLVHHDHLPKGECNNVSDVNTASAQFTTGKPTPTRRVRATVNFLFLVEVCLYAIAPWIMSAHG